MSLDTSSAAAFVSGRDETPHGSTDHAASSATTDHGTPDYVSGAKPNLEKALRFARRVMREGKNSDGKNLAAAFLDQSHRLAFLQSAPPPGAVGPRGFVAQSVDSGAQFIAVPSRKCSTCSAVSHSGFCPFCSGRVAFT